MESRESAWTVWPIAWSAVWVGALTALAVGLIIGLVGFAVGANEVADSVNWSDLRLISLVFSIGGAFFAFVAGGWVAARIAGRRRSEPAMLHGAIVWLLTVPLLLVLAASGGMGHFGGWYGGLGAMPTVAQIAGDSNLAEAVRNNALASVAALLLGLVGAVLGGWMASGEPMSLTYHRTRDRVTAA